MNTSTRKYAHSYSILCIVCVCITMSIMPVAASDGDVYLSPGMTSSIAVTKFSVYPETLAPFESGTISVTVRNIGTFPAQIERINVDGKDIVVTNNVEDQRNTIGVGDTRDFTFSFMAPAREGTFYPSLLIQTAKSGYTRYPFSIKVDKAEAQISLAQRSARFNPGIESSVTLQIANPRSNTIRAVQVHPIYDFEAFESMVPNAIYIGDLLAGSTADAVFAMTPRQDTMVQFVLAYMNGDNPNQVIYELPIVLGQDKRLASPMLSNVMVMTSGSSYRVSGSISNAGLENANGLVITSGSPARPVYPDREYVVGVLKPDDFSRTFAITFEADSAVRSVPVLITYKDNSGNVHEIEYVVDLPPPVVHEEEKGPQPVKIKMSQSDLIVMAGCIVVILAGAYLMYRLVRRKSD